MFIKLHSPKASLTRDESGLLEASVDATKTDDEDIEMESSDSVVVKLEKSHRDESERLAEDDDDVIMMPTEEPIVTEILDESEINEKAPAAETSITDDDVMIQEPKIETQLVPDDDDDDDYQNPSQQEDALQQNLIVKIKEEPKDDGYEDLVNEEDDAFVEVTAIANDDMMQGELF